MLFDPVFKFHFYNPPFFFLIYGIDVGINMYDEPDDCSWQEMYHLMGCSTRYEPEDE